MAAASTTLPWYDIPQPIDVYWEPKTPQAKALMARGMEAEAKRADLCPIPYFWTCPTGCIEAEHWYCDLKFCEGCAARRAIRDAENFLLAKGPYLRAIKEFFTLEVATPWSNDPPSREYIEEFGHDMLLWIKKFQDSRDGCGSKYRVAPQSSRDGRRHRLLAKVVSWGDIDPQQLRNAPGQLTYTRHRPEALRDQIILTLRMEVPCDADTQALYEQIFKEVRSVRTTGGLHADLTKQPAPEYETCPREELAVSNTYTLTANDESSTDQEPKVPSAPPQDAEPCLRRCRKHGLPMTRVEHPGKPQGPPG